MLSQSFLVTGREKAEVPAGSGVAHSFWGGEEPLTVLAYGPSDPRDLCFYPDSDKILVAGLNVVFRVEPVDYWDGEE